MSGIPDARRQNWASKDIIGERLHLGKIFDAREFIMNQGTMSSPSAPLRKEKQPASGGGGRGRKIEENFERKIKV